MTSFIQNKVGFALMLGVFLVAMYFFSWPGLILTFLGVLVLGTAYSLFWLRPRVTAANAVLYEEGDPEGFLEEMERLIGGRTFPKGDGDRVRDSLRINRTAGLFFAGRWTEALDVLDAIHPGELSPPMRQLHFNNKLACLNALEELDGAEAWVAANRSLIESPPGFPEMRLSLAGNLAVLERLRGDPSRSRAMLEECLAEIAGMDAPHTGLLSAVTLYQLGRVDLDEGRTDDAKARFEEAVHLAPKTYIPGKVEEVMGDR